MPVNAKMLKRSRGVDLVTKQGCKLVPAGPSAGLASSVYLVSSVPLVKTH